MTQAQFHEGPNGALAYLRQPGRGPGLFWLGGFSSDMSGTKADFLGDWAAREGRAFLRFDYSGHGLSAGRFEDGTIGGWLADALSIFDAQAEGPQILVGSSMGGWIAALLALRRKARIAGLVLIAPAPDFTEALVLSGLSPADRTRLFAEGRLELASPYGGKTVFTGRLIEEGRGHLLLGGPIDILCPVRILQGMKDEEVPYPHALRFAALLASRDVEVTLVKEGGHRLSEPADLDRLVRTVATLCAAIGLQK
jgi:pimeloyl-ACP methyl ester carboxylesterase